MGNTTFDFDAFEQLKQIKTPSGQTVAPDYDGLGRRVTSPQGALSYAGMGVRPVADGARRFQRGPLGVIATDDMVDGGAAWAFADEHSDVVGVFDAGDMVLDG
ncbi:MAG TPA: hypothetical protein VGJ86_20450, partial [Acidimicrobiales bacterium]